MTDSRASITRRYQIGLRAYLKAGRRSTAGASRGLGMRALAVGLTSLDLARLHEETLVRVLASVTPPSRRTALIEKAAAFFAEAVASATQLDRAVPSVAEEVNRFVRALSRRTVELATSNRDLNREIALRKAAEEALKKSERHYSELLARSDRLQTELRRLSRQILSAQEEERRRISRELHDVIAQTLTGINVRLAALKREASINTRGLDVNIERTQKLVEQSVDIVHRFARELRPAVLDDLGLIPALDSFLKQFGLRTGIRVRLSTSTSAASSAELLDSAQRTVLFRVAQEALTNVERHARAKRVLVTLSKGDGQICMKVADNGRSFPVRRVLQSLGGRGLGLLGMRERLEMVGGHFDVNSLAGRGTTVLACIPIQPGVPLAGNAESPAQKAKPN